MRNIEIKCVLSDRRAVEARLAELGAEEVWVARQRDTFYTVPRGWLKLREHEGGEAELIAYARATDTSGPRASDFERAVIDDVQLWKRLLAKALPVDIVVQKERTLWMYRHTRVHLDRVEDLGDYLELETLVGEIEEDEARAENEAVIEALALDRDSFLAVPYRDLLL